VRCLFGFALGMIGWRLTSAVQAIALPKMADHLVEIAVVAATVALVRAAGAGPLSVAAPFMFLLAVLVFSRERGLVSGLLKRGPFVLLGTLSYSIYMIHGFLYYRFVNILTEISKRTGSQIIHSEGGHDAIGGAPLFGDAMSLLFLAGVIAASYFSYRWVEKPGQDWSRRLFRKRSEPPLPPPPGAP
jgi:peptidoglycan/LPS O-acetylase OafA/YrhL